MKYAKILILLFICSLMGACKTAQPTATDKYVMKFERDDVWVLTAMRQKEVTYGENQEPITLQFNPEAMSFSGYAGCNRYFGDYTYTPSSDQSGALTLEHVGYTRMACPDPEMKLENQYLPLINKATSCVMTAYRLTIMQGTKVILEFEKQ